MSASSLPPYQPSYDGDEADAIAADAARRPAELEHVCEECGRAYKSARAVAIHRGKAHKPKARARALRNGRPSPLAADTMRELVAKFDRLAELQTETRELEHEMEQLQARLVKAWQR